MTEPQTTEIEQQLARRARNVALVMAGTMILWLGGQWLGRTLGMPGKYAFLFDFAALAAFIWALVVTNQIRRARRAGQPSGRN